MVFFGVAIVLAILLTPQRRQFAQKWIWLVGFVALVIALPNIIWQIDRGWPTWALLHGIAKSNKNVVLSPWEFFFQQITLMNPATFPLWFGGLIWLLVSHEGRRYRVIAFTYLIALTEFVVMHGKNYYLAPAYPMLFAAGGVAQTGDCVSRRRVSGRLRTGRSPHFITGEIARLFARDSFRGPTNGNVAYCGITPTLCRPIRLGGDGALGRTSLRQLACE